ncbi:hypothetical protein ADIAL_1362 [Alkalibacterium sp. AK22]|nr:hypothetical protein ADIAL_1362 [Alkalibacterium sp. AK22]
MIIHVPRKHLFFLASRKQDAFTVVVSIGRDDSFNQFPFSVLLLF